jgi:hypothetical protein
MDLCVFDIYFLISLIQMDQEAMSVLTIEI